MSRLRQTFVAILFGRGLMAVRQLLLVPILIKAWGIDYYGGWLIISSIPSFLSMSNLGLGTSAAARIATRKGDDSMELSKVTVATAWSLISSVLILVMLALAGWNAARPGSFSALEHGYPILLLLLAAYFVRLLAQPVHGWWVSQGKSGRSLHLNNVQACGELVVFAVIPLAGGNALQLSAVGLAWSLAWLVAYLWISSAAGCPLLFKARPKMAEAKALLSTGVGHQLSPLWQAILFQGSIMAAGALFGAPGAALWGALRVVTRAGNQVLELVSQSVGPEFQLNCANGDIPANRALHARAVVLSVAVSTMIACGLMIFGNQVFQIWTQHAFTVSPVVWWIMPLSLIPFSLWWVSGEYQRSVNRPWSINLWGVASASISLGVTWALRDLGIPCLAWGGLVFEVLMSIRVVPTTLKLLGDSTGGLWRESIRICREGIRSCSRGDWGSLLKI